jgi:hypothetical protein
MSHRIRAPLPCTRSSPPGLACSSATGGRDVVGEHRRVVPLGLGERARRNVLGFVFRASAMVLPLGSITPVSGIFAHIRCCSRF